MTDNTMMPYASFIGIYPFRDINSVILQHLYHTQLIFIQKFIQQNLWVVYASVIENRSNNFYAMQV